jgi:hypothetical protein
MSIHHMSEGSYSDTVLASGVQNHFPDFTQIEYRQMARSILANPYTRSALWLSLELLYQGLDNGVLLGKSEWR